MTLAKPLPPLKGSHQEIGLFGPFTVLERDENDPQYQADLARWKRECEKKINAPQGYQGMKLFRAIIGK